jgi:hypothetical protein
MMMMTRCAKCQPGTISALCLRERLLFVDDARKVNYLYLQNTEALCATRYDIAERAPSPSLSDAAALVFVRS